MCSSLEANIMAIPYARTHSKIKGSVVLPEFLKHFVAPIIMCCLQQKRHVWIAPQLADQHDPLTSDWCIIPSKFYYRRLQHGQVLRVFAVGKHAPSRISLGSSSTAIRARMYLSTVKGSGSLLKMNNQALNIDLTLPASFLLTKSSETLPRRDIGPIRKLYFTRRSFVPSSLRPAGWTDNDLSFSP